MFNPAQVDSYRNRGYVVYPSFLSQAELQKLRAEIDVISGGNTLASHDTSRVEMEPDQPLNGTRVRRIYEPCTYYPVFQALSESPKLLDCIEQLIGPNLLFHYSKVNMKPPEIGSVVEWHQDLTYYPLTNDKSVTVLFYLDDATAANGCLKVIPGRHKERPYNHTRDGFFQGKITEPVDESDAVLLEGKAGGAIFMHCLAPHSSATNSSNQSRRTLILSYRSADAYPIFHGEMSVKGEAHVRLVRGQMTGWAVFSMKEFPIPRYRESITSLYDLQRRSRQDSAA